MIQSDKINQSGFSMSDQYTEVPCTLFSRLKVLSTSLHREMRVEEREGVWV